MLDRVEGDRTTDAIAAYEAAHEDLLPQDSSARIGDGDYVAIGVEFLRLMVEMGGLAPSADILDIGCGLGRIAQPLRFYLAPQARYTGIDVARENVDWCQENIRDEQDRFHFAHLDVRHPLYNPEGSIAPERAWIPFADEAFDFVMMISVFTHFSAEMTAQYLSEVRRLLRPGGRIFATFFLINDRTRAAAASNHRYPFSLDADGPVFTPPEDDNFAAAAIEENWLLEQAIERQGLRLITRRDGHWPEVAPAPGTPFQDIKVFEK